MSPTGLILMLSLSLAMADGPPPPPSPQPSIDAATPVNADDPYELMALADALSVDSSRQDELVAVLMTGVRLSGTADAASTALERVLLTEPARSGWELAYRELLMSGRVDNPRLLKVRYAEARSMAPHTRAKALVDLGAMLQEKPNDDVVRNALGDAYLRSGRADRALQVFRDGQSSSQVWKGEVAALMTLGRIDEAIRVGGEVVPGACRTSPAAVPCALGLRQMGYPEAARSSLETAAKGARNNTEKASYFAALARLERAENPSSDTVRLWEKVVALDRSEPSYRDALAAALLDRQRPDRARQIITDTRNPLYRSIEAIEIVNKVDVNSTTAATRERLEDARRSDGSHPVVVRAWSHHLIVSGNAEEAVRVLDPYIQNHAAETEWRQLYVWAAGNAGAPAKAADALRDGLSHARATESWQKLRADLATYESIAGNDAKAAGRLDEAVARLRLAHALDPLTVAHLVALGGAFWERSTAARDPISRDAELGRAEAAFAEAVRTAPRNRDALIAMVNLLRAQGRAEEARRLLVASGYTDAAILRLERELEMYAVAGDARQAAALGQYAVARERFEQLLLVYPGEKVLLHGLADALAGLGEHEAAARTYALARQQDPDDIWLALGEVRARIATGMGLASQPDLASDHLDRAEYVLTAIGEPARGAEAQAWNEAQALLDRGRADLVAAGGNTRQAYRMYRRVLDGEDSRGPDADAILYSGLAGLYMSTWQYGAAEAYYEEALDLDSDLGEAERGVIQALVAKGQYERAQERAGRLAVQRPTARNIELAEMVARRRAIDDAARYAVNGDIELARRILDEQRATWPDALEIQVALAAVSLRQGDADGAFDLAAGVLEVEPTNPGGLAALQASALRTRRTDEAIPFYQAAYEASGQAWLRKEMHALELASLLNRAVDADALGQHERGSHEIEEAARYFGDATARHWTMIGGASLEVGNHDRAMAAFATARHLDPRDSGAAIGTAGALQARGQPGEAKALLKEHWDEWHDIDVGLALAEAQADLGQHMASQRTLEQVQDRARMGGVRGNDPAPPALEVRALPSGRQAPSAEDELRKPPDVPASLPTTSIRDLEEDIQKPYRFSGTAGVGTAARPGDARRNYLGVIYAPIGAELAIWRQLRVQAEVVPLQVTDGVRTVEATSASGGLSFGIGDALSASARVGSSPFGPGLPADPYTTWSGMVSARLAQGFTAGLETVRAPVTDSFHSFIGTVDANGDVSGRVRDSWLGVSLSRGWRSGASLGAIGRWGQSDGLLLAPGGTADGMVPWEQAMLYGRAPVFSQGEGSIWLGGEVLYLDHDRQVDAFGPGGAGMFSPDRFYSAMARVEGLLGDDPNSNFTACGLFGVGPQVVEGNRTLYLGPGTNLGYELKGSLAWNLADRWALVGHLMHQGTWAVWSQTTALAQLRFGRSENTLSAPSANLASMVHGPPMMEPAHCSVDWKKVEADR